MALLRRLLTGWSAWTQGRTDFATPDVPRTQQIAVGQAIVAVLVVLGFDLDPTTQQLLIGLSVALAAALPVSDAIVRRARAANVETIKGAQDEKADASITSQLGIDEDAKARLLADLLELGPGT